MCACQFLPWLKCPVDNMNRHRTCLFPIYRLGMTVSEKVAQFIYCCFNGQGMKNSDLICITHNRLWEQLSFCQFAKGKNEMWGCSDFATFVLREFNVLEINVNQNDYQQFNFNVNVDFDIIRSENELKALPAGTALFLVDASMFTLFDPSNPIPVNRVTVNRLRFLKVRASHVLFYLGIIPLYSPTIPMVGGMNHTGSPIKHGVHGIHLFFSFNANSTVQYCSAGYNATYYLLAWRY